MSNKKKSSYIPIYFIAFILTFVAIDAIYIYVAKNTYSGVYTDDHYQKGIDYSKANSKGIGVIGDEDILRSLNQSIKMVHIDGILFFVSGKAIIAFYIKRNKGIVGFSRRENPLVHGGNDHRFKIQVSTLQHSHNLKAR